jgi:acetyl-CoA acetyltransferase
MAGSNDVVIIAGCRTPIGKFQGSLGDLSATQLGAIAVREAVKRANLEPQRWTSASWATLCRRDSVRTQLGRQRCSGDWPRKRVP